MMGQGQDSTWSRKWKQLSEKERYTIEALRKEGMSASKVAQRLGRERRTVDRELKRGKVRVRRLNPYVSRNPAIPDYVYEDRYYADAGQRVKEERASQKGRRLKIGCGHDLVAYIERKIGKEKYSPDAVIGQIKAQGLEFSVSICTRTLYNYIARGLFLGISNADLPMKKRGKKRRYRPTRTVALNNKTGRSIEERPEEVAGREAYGHWEMDCVVGKGRACLLVLTERKTRQELVMKMAQKTQACVKSCLDQLERRHKGRFTELFKSITTDNGSEFLGTGDLETSCLRPGAKRTTIYYAHPYSAFERGSNENTNRLIRRFIPKGMDIGKFTHADIRRIQRWIIDYPRRIFGFLSANQMTTA